MKDLIWVEKTLINKLKLIDEVEEIKQEDIKELAKRFKEEVTDIIDENIDSNVLNLRLKAQQVRDSYIEVVNEEIEKTNELWEDLDGKRYEINNKLTSLKDKANGISADINRIKGEINNIDFYGIDRLIECIDKINRLTEEDKQLLNNLFISHR